MKFGSGMLRGAYLSAGIRLTGNLIRRKESTYPPTINGGTFLAMEINYY